ncbi:MAG: hypothetical protein RSB05_07025 [Clostridiales bacterium]
MKMLEGFLITVRTAKQGTAMEKGKFSDEYIKEISMLNVNPDDLAELSLDESMKAVLKSAETEIEVTCREAKGPRGVFFLPLGQPANYLLGKETHGTGVPDYKGIPVQLSALLSDNKGGE